jgi:AcrR family transcriptional regulator
VSPGLVQHHFKSKAELRRAVDEHAVAVFSAAFEGMDDRDDALDLFTEVSRRITRVVAESPDALRYVARSVAEGDTPALTTFDRFVEIADGVIDRLAQQGALRADADLRWAALHGVMLNLATVLFEPAISRHLDRPFATPAETQRWSAATTALFARGILAAPAP